MKPILLLALAAAALLPAAAQAHTPYLAPSDFAPGPKSTLALDASFAEAFFVPEVAFDNSRFEVIGPDGHSVALEGVQVMKTRAVADYTLAGNGTYRFSTGHRSGAVFRTWELDGKTTSSRDPAQAVPAGARLLSHFQSRTRAETYVTAGAPDQAALKAHDEGLELVAITHPGDLYAGERFELEVRFDGKPMAGHKIEFTGAVWSSGQKPVQATLVTDAQGRATFDMAEAGTYLALVRHRAPAPVGAAAPEYSHSYTLSFRVLEQ